MFIYEIKTVDGDGIKAGYFVVMNSMDLVMVIRRFRKEFPMCSTEIIYACKSFGSAYDWTKE